MACWPASWVLALQSRPDACIPTSPSIDIVNICEEFEVLGGGDINSLRSALESPSAICDDFCNVERLEDEDVLAEKGMSVFGRHSEYLLVGIRGRV